MDKAGVEYFKAIGAVQGVIANAPTIDEAIRSSLRVIVDRSGAESAVIWYMDARGDGELHPYFWIGPVDLTSRSHAPGHGAVGRVFSSQQAERLLAFDDHCGVVQFVNGHERGEFAEEAADVMEIMAMMAEIAIDEKEAISRPWNPGTPIMELRDITREFQNGDVVTKVLKGVNLDVYDGEFLVLLGESGCGKTTLLNIIGGMDQATSGSVSYLGRDLTSATPDEMTEYRRGRTAPARTSPACRRRRAGLRQWTGRRRPAARRGAPRRF